MSSPTKEKGLHVVMFPWFAFGHISPFAQLSNKLSSRGIRISFFTASGTVHRVESMLRPSPNTQIIPLTLPRVEGLPPGVENTVDATPNGAELLKIALDLMQPQIKTLLSQLKPHFVVFDFVQQWLPPMASQLGIKTICFSIGAAITSAFFINPARLSLGHSTPTPPATDELKKPPPGYPKSSQITSLKTFEAENTSYMFKSFYGCPCAHDRVAAGYAGSTAILINTCMDMEKHYVDYLRTLYNKPVQLIGPLVPEPPSGTLDEKWVTWLGKFPPKSVIYCSFGSESFLNDDQIKNLALGLELTGLPFFLVLNFPGFVDGRSELNRTLPEGFVGRVKDMGIVHTGWVQQQHILAHVSVGCYLCHVGLTSVAEALLNDCQLVMLPQKNDQFLNAKLVALELKAGVEVNRKDEDGYFGKEDIYEAVKSVMVEVDTEPALSIRANHKKWKEFLQNDEIQNKLLTDLVEDMKALM